jgi:hypothetical protein
MNRFTYQQLVELVGGDRELLERLLDEGEIEGVIERRDDVVALVDVDRVLVARTLVRELGVDWADMALILRLVSELAEARRRIAELEAELGAPGHGSSTR